MLWYKLSHMGHSSIHICEIWKSICPQKVKHKWWAVWTILLKQGRITVLIFELGPFPTLGHSSDTKQSVTWREWVCPKECLSLIAEPGPFPTLGHSSGTKQSATWREWLCRKEWLSGPFPKEMTVLHQPPNRPFPMLTTMGNRCPTRQVSHLE